MANDEGKPQNKFSRMISYFVSIKELLVAIVAIATSVYTLVKPQDTKITQRSYEILVNRTNEIAKAAENNHDDIGALRGYLEGYIKGTSKTEPITGSSLTPLAIPSSKPLVPYVFKPKRIPSIDDIAKIDGDGIADTSDAPPLPSLSPRTLTQTPPPFAQVIQSAK